MVHNVCLCSPPVGSRLRPCILCASVACLGRAPGSVCCVWWAGPKLCVSVQAVGPLCTAHHVRLRACRVCPCYLLCVYGPWLASPCGVMCLHLCVCLCGTFVVALTGEMTRIRRTCVRWTAFMLWFCILCVAEKSLGCVLCACGVFCMCCLELQCVCAACFSASQAL